MPYKQTLTKAPMMRIQKIALFITVTLVVFFILEMYFSFIKRITILESQEPESSIMEGCILNETRIAELNELNSDYRCRRSIIKYYCRPTLEDNRSRELFKGKTYSLYLVDKKNRTICEYKGLREDE